MDDQDLFVDSKVNISFILIFCLECLDQNKITSQFKRIWSMDKLRDEHGTGPVPIPYRISGTDFFPSINSGTGTVPNGIRIPVPGNRVFPFLFRNFPIWYRSRTELVVPIFFHLISQSRYRTVYRDWYRFGTVPGFGSKCSSLTEWIGYFSNRKELLQGK